MKVGLVAESAEEDEALRSGAVPNPFFDTHVATLLARTVVVATKLRIFEAMTAGGKAPGEIASFCSLAPGPTTNLLRALAGAGYVTESKGLYSLTPISSRWLLTESPMSIRDYILELELNEWKWAEHYERFVRTGTPILIHENMSDEQWATYQRGMRSLATGPAEELAARVTIPKGARDMLDIGGSHGYYSVAFCRRYSGLRAVVLDLPAAVKHAAPILAKENLGKRVTHQAGDARTEELGVEAFDLILISHLAHHFDEMTNKRLFHRCCIALRPGGLLVVQDGIRAEHADSGGQAAALLDLFCGVVSASGTWTFEQIAEWQRAAGFIPDDAVWLQSTPGVGYLVAEKDS